jgi:hypothetical protein
MRSSTRLLAVALLLFPLAAASPARANPPVATPVPLPGGAPGIGFDDLQFSKQLGKVLVPAARSGRLDLVDPVTLAVTPIAGFSAEASYDGGHDFGATSVDEGAGLLFVTDRTSQKLDLVDPKTRAIVASAPLAAGPDYVRFVPPAELWVTEPDHAQIEIFTLSAGPHVKVPSAKHAATIAVAGGPESLVIDRARHRAYANLWRAKTVAIDLASRAIVERWENGCKGSRGLALDGARGFLFVGCAEGNAVTLDVAHHGKQLSTLHAGDGVDVIAFSPHLSHLYFPGARSATLAIMKVSPSGHLSLLGTFPTAPHAHCVTTDDATRIFVCAPTQGHLLLIQDPYR